MGTDDRQVRQFLAQFTLLELREIDELVHAHAAEPGRRSAQRRLAQEVTALVHGADEAAAAEEASSILFGAPAREATEGALDAVRREVPTVEVSAEAIDEGIDLIDLLATTPGLASSKGEAKRALTQGGVYVNGERAGEGLVVGRLHLLHGRYVLLRRGKKAHGLVVVAR
jgi:tyrosyl-tRNA synthetase